MAMALASLPRPRSGPASAMVVPQNAKNPSSVDWGCDTYSRENATILQNWLSSQGLPPQKLALEAVDAGGRGLVAKSVIRKGEKLLNVPSSLIITTDSDWSNPQAGVIIAGEKLPEWPFLASYLISEASQSENSRWNAYISALPRQPESILQWSRTEINRYLWASSLIDQALNRIADVEETYDGLVSSIYSKHPDLFPGKFFTLEAFKWAFGILFSRLVRLQSLDQQVALVPWADMLNHSSQVHACLDFEVSSKAVVLSTDQTYQPMEQVFISYGNKSNGELLLSYGFIPEDNNEADSVDVLLALNPEDEMFAAKQEVLREYGLSSSCRYPLTISGMPSQLVAFAHLVICPPSMSSHFFQMAAAAASKGMPIWNVSGMPLLDVSPDVEIQAYVLILTTIEAALSKLSRFLQDNQVISNGNVTKRDELKESSRDLTKMKVACTLSKSEQRILYRQQNILRRKLQELRRKNVSGENFSFASGKRPGLLYGLSKLFK